MILVACPCLAILFVRLTALDHEALLSDRCNDDVQGYMARYTKQSAVQAMQAYCDIAQKYGVSPTELALAWCQAQSWTTCSIIGATNMKQLKASVSYLSP